MNEHLTTFYYNDHTGIYGYSSNMGTFRVAGRDNNWSVRVNGVLLMRTASLDQARNWINFHTERKRETGHYSVTMVPGKGYEAWKENVLLGYLPEPGVRDPDVKTVFASGGLQAILRFISEHTIRN